MENGQPHFVAYPYYLPLPTYYSLPPTPYLLLPPPPLPPLSPTDLTAYLGRLDLPAGLPPKLDTLTRLQQRHMESIAFENFSVYLGVAPVIELNSLLRKVLYQRRGGYCFELNTLYAALLTSLGYTVMPVMARVLLRDPAQTPPRTHLTNLVSLDGRTYVSDVGFGGLASRIPLCIDDAAEVDDGDGTVRVQAQPYGEFSIQRHTPGGWQNQYRFETRPAEASDVLLGNYYTHSHPDSHFVQHRFIGRFTPTGRIGLFGNQFSERHGIEVVHIETVPDGPRWIDFVRERFGLPLELPPEQLDRLMIAKPDHAPVN